MNLLFVRIRYSWLVGKPNRQGLGSGVPQASSNQSQEINVNNSIEYLILKNTKKHAGAAFMELVDEKGRCCHFSQGRGQICYCKISLV